MKLKINVQKMVRTSILAAIASMLFLFQFPLPFMPPFMSFDLSGIPEIIGTISMGTGSGIAIVFIKNLIKLVLKGSGSMLTGEIQNLILSSAYLIPIGLICRKTEQPKRQTLLLGMVIGMLCSSFLAIFSNLFLIIPVFTKLYGFSMDYILEITHAVNRFIDTQWKFVVMGIIPFNLIKTGVTTLVAYIIYPKAVPALAQGGKYELS